MNLQIYEEASDWIIKHRDGGLDAAAKKSFDAWLRESPHHLRAYLEMSSVWEDLPSLNAEWNPTAEVLIARARADDNVVSLASSPDSCAPSSTRGARTDDRSSAESDRRETTASASLWEGAASAQTPVRPTGERPVHANRKVQFISALAASILITLASGWLYLQRGVYTTEVGEQRSLALADGSTVELNSRSRIKVEYSEHERRIDLLEGQALFRVAKSKARPFIVQTGNTRVRAVGTAFDVYKTSSDTIVTVVEGRVAVHTSRRLDGGPSALPQDRRDGTVGYEAPAPGIDDKSRRADQVAARSESRPGATGLNATGGEVFVAAGEQLVVSPSAVAAPKRTNIATAMAWTRRSLVFDSSPLTEVAQEFNRYNARPLVIEDPRLADFHVSGVFSSVEPSLLLRFLRMQPELAVEETDTEIRISRK